MNQATDGKLGLPAREAGPQVEPGIDPEWEAKEQAARERGEGGEADDDEQAG